MPESQGNGAQAAGGAHGYAPEEIALTRNTTDGVTTVVSGAPLAPGDEILMSDQEHLPFLGIFYQRVARDGVVIWHVRHPMPAASADELAGPFEEAVTPRTRLVFVCQSTTPARSRLCADYATSRIHAASGCWWTRWPSATWWWTSRRSIATTTRAPATSGGAKPLSRDLYSMLDSPTRTPDGRFVIVSREDAYHWDSKARPNQPGSDWHAALGGVASPDGGARRSH